MRVWFDQQLNDSTPNILETPDFTPINLSMYCKSVYISDESTKLKLSWIQVAQYHLLEEEFKEWAAKTGGAGKLGHL